MSYLDTLDEDEIAAKRALDALNVDIARKKGLLTQKQKEAAEYRPISVQDALVQGAVSLAPMLIGKALAGDAGALAGIQGGKVGGDAFLQRVQQKMQSDMTQDLLDVEGMKTQLAADEAMRKEQQKEIEYSGRRKDRLEDKLAIEQLDIQAKEARSALPAEVKDVLARVNAGEKVTTEELRLLEDYPEAANRAAKYAYKNIGEQGVTARGEALEMQKEAREYEKALGIKERSIVGLEGQAKSDKEAYELRQKQEAIAEIERLMLNLTASLEGNGPAISGQAYNEQLVLMSGLVNQSKERFGGGAAFTELEKKLAFMALPKIWADPTVSVSEIMAEGALGRDQIDKMKKYLKVVRGEFTTSALVQGLKVPENYSPYEALVKAGLIKTEPVGSVKTEAPTGTGRKTIADFKGDKAAYNDYLDQMLAQFEGQ